jgi:hypothetical protein
MAPRGYICNQQYKGRQIMTDLQFHSLRSYGMLMTMQDGIQDDAGSMSFFARDAEGPEQSRGARSE